MPAASVQDGLDRERVDNQFLATEIVLRDVYGLIQGMTNEMK